jgi:hypothetical protein
MTSCLGNRKNLPTAALRERNPLVRGSGVGVPNEDTPTAWLIYSQYGRAR